MIDSAVHAVLTTSAPREKTPCLGKDDAITTFLNAIARNPDVGDIYRVLFELRSGQGRPKDALRVLRQGASRSFEARHLEPQVLLGYGSSRKYLPARVCVRLASLIWRTPLMPSHT